jgi:hypothetical protein
MTEIIIKMRNDKTVRAFLYEKEAPITSKAFLKKLPIRLRFFHTKNTGTEILCEEGPLLNTPQENISVYRIGFKGCMSIIYGTMPKPRKCMNIFARIIDEDLETLEQIGLLIWKEGAQKLDFTRGSN